MLDKANRPLERTYRKTYRAIAPRLPFGLARLLPAPRVDSTRKTRMNVVPLVSRLGSDAGIAAPAMGGALKDEGPGVRALAISFFTSTEDEHALLNQLDKKQKRKLLPSSPRRPRSVERGGRPPASAIVTQSSAARFGPNDSVRRH